MSPVRHNLAGELAFLTRGGQVESVHLGHACVVTAGGELLDEIGDSATVVLARSTIKPAQASASMQCGADLSATELAIAAASHTGEVRHQELVSQILDRNGLSPEDLQCPADWPEDEATREQQKRDGVSKTRLAMNCSGKHAAMLAAAQSNGWCVDNYLEVDHPVQRVVMETLSELSGETIETVSIDGCGAPAPALSVRGLATMAARLGRSSPVATAMRLHPWAVGGTGQINSTVMEMLPGVIAKGGAEGVFVLGTESGFGVAIKVIDGSPRATTFVALHLLGRFGVDVESVLAATRISILGGGKEVGTLEIGADIAQGQVRCS